MVKRRWIIVLGCWLCGAGGLPSTVAGDRATLRDCYRACGKECGTTLMPKGLDDEAYKQILARQFSLVVPDYGMYMSDLQPRRGVWDFASADRIVEFASTHQLKIRGHVLLYDFPASRRGEKWTPTPRWVYDGNYSRDEMIKIMNDHIETVMRHYRDCISQWIVVTEAVGNYLPGQMEDNIWLKLAEQARLYSLVMNTALRSPSCAGLTVWGYTDKYSWIDTFNAFPGYVNACLFAADLRPKSIFPSLLRDLESTSRDGGKEK